MNLRAFEINQLAKALYPRRPKIARHGGKGNSTVHRDPMHRSLPETGSYFVSCLRARESAFLVSPVSSFSPGCCRSAGVSIIKYVIQIAEALPGSPARCLAALCDPKTRKIPFDSPTFCSLHFPRPRAPRNRGAQPLFRVFFVWTCVSREWGRTDGLR